MLKVNCTVDREQTRRSRGEQEVVEWWSGGVMKLVEWVGEGWERVGEVKYELPNTPRR
jgi:hypothetical protein